MPREEDLEFVIARLEMQPLEGPVEVIHGTCVVAVDEHLGLSRAHLQPQ